MCCNGGQYRAGEYLAGLTLLACGPRISVQAMKWWSLDEIEVSTETIFPHRSRKSDPHFKPIAEFLTRQPPPQMRPKRRPPIDISNPGAISQAFSHEAGHAVIACAVGCQAVTMSAFKARCGFYPHRFDVSSERTFGLSGFCTLRILARRNRKLPDFRHPDRAALSVCCTRPSATSSLRRAIPIR
jgi:hypothetical protein